MKCMIIGKLPVALFYLWHALISKRLPHHFNFYICNKLIVKNLRSLKCFLCKLNNCLWYSNVNVMFFYLFYMFQWKSNTGWGRCLLHPRINLQHVPDFNRFRLSFHKQNRLKIFVYQITKNFQFNLKCWLCINKLKQFVRFLK